LLVLDNCEHVLDGCAQLAHGIIRNCPRVTMITTSREPLRIVGELCWPVPPLSLSSASSSVQDGAPSEAVQLFLDRARAVQPKFDGGELAVAAVVEICARLDGLGRS
jgi:predicted ATPase